MSDYPNYRVAVEVVLCHQGKVLLAKRASDCAISPDCWCVPAGKVKYEEIPLAAAVREFKEETGIDVRVVKEIDCRAFKVADMPEETFRLIYTYRVEPVSSGDVVVRLNNEHSEYAWCGPQGFANPKYATLHDRLKTVILRECFGN